MTDPAVERACLAGVYRHSPDSWSEVEDLLSPECFTVPASLAIYRCFRHVVEHEPKTKLDAAVIEGAASALGLSEFFSRTDEAKHLRAVIQMPVELSNLRALAGQLRKLLIARCLHAKLGQGASSLEQVTGQEPLSDILSLAEAPIQEIVYQTSLAESGGQELTPFGKDLPQYVDFLIENPVQQEGIPTPFKKWDESVGGGLAPGSVHVWAARSKQGKSQALLYTQLRIAHAGFPCLYLDTEMNQRQVRHRALSCVSGVQAKKIRTGRLTPVEQTAVRKAAADLEKMPFMWRSVQGQQLDQTLSLMRRWLHKVVGFNPDGTAKSCVIVYDYIKLMASNAVGKNMAEYQAIGYLTSSLKDFMGRYGVSCLTAVQLNREGLTREDEAAIAQSDRVTWFADSVTLFKKKEPQEEAEEAGAAPQFTHKFKTLVTRDGEGLLDGDYINIQADLSRCRFREGPTKYELEKNGGEPNGAFRVDQVGEIVFGDARNE